MTSFKELCDDLLDKFHKREIRKNDITKMVCEEFHIVPAVFRMRFKSMYGCNLSGVCDTITKPTRSELIFGLMRSDNVDDLWRVLDIPKYYRKNILQEILGVPTFTKAKVLISKESADTSYEPSIYENRSLVISQVLNSNNSYSERSGSIRMVELGKDLEYIVWKAAMFNKAFPTTNPSGTTVFKEDILSGNSSVWNSGRLPSKITSLIDCEPECDLVDYLTPRGFFLWVIDTNSWLNDSLEIGFSDRDLLDSVYFYLKSFGIHTKIVDDSLVTLGNNSVMFYKNFIEPFKESLPECLQYKCNMKI